MNNKFTIELSSDLDYEEMVVYISWENELIALLNCENGLENLEIELLNANEKSVKIPFNDYLEVLDFAKKTLLNSKKKE